MIVSKKQMQNKLKKIYKDRHRVKCQICGEEISENEDPDLYEYVKTKRGSEFFFHTKCVKGW